MKSKPVVRYDKFTYESCDETHAVKQKLTRIAVLKGQEVKAVNKAREDGYQWYIGNKGKETLEFYKVETVEVEVS